MRVGLGHPRSVGVRQPANKIRHGAYPSGMGAPPDHRLSHHQRSGEPDPDARC